MIYRFGGPLVSFSQFSCILIELQFNIAFLKITSLGNHNAKDDSCILIAVLDLGYYNNLLLVGYSRLNAFKFSKMTSLQIMFQSREWEKVIRTQVQRIGRLRSHKNIFTSKKTRL